MKKQEILSGDMVVFRNKKNGLVTTANMYILREYYNDDLTCKSNPEYDIVKVLRPSYEVIYAKEEFAKVKNL